MRVQNDLTRVVLADGAACVGMDPEAFFPIEGDEPVSPDVAAACAGCPRRRPCLAFALTHPVVGVWAGTNTERRVQLRRLHGISAGRRLRPQDRENDDDQHPVKTEEQTR